MAKLLRNGALETRSAREMLEQGPIACAQAIVAKLGHAHLDDGVLSHETGASQGVRFGVAAANWRCAYEEARTAGAVAPLAVCVILAWRKEKCEISNHCRGALLQWPCARAAS